MTMAAGIAPLTNTQKIFLQRLLAQHVLTDEKARELLASVNEGFGNSQNDHHDDFDRTLGKINASLVPAFNLEICTVSLPSPYTNNENDNGNGNGKASSSRTSLVKYHAIVNRSNDAIAKTNAFPSSRGSNGPHEMAYVRLLIERIIERGSMLLENSSSNAYPAVGCPGGMNRMEIINLRTELEGAHKGQVTIAQAEMVLGLLVEEGWLVRVAPPSYGGEKNAEEDDDNDDDEDEEGNNDRRKKRRARSNKSSTKKGGTFYGIGPRTFMELGDFLLKAGLPADRLPQSILHRA